MSPTPSAVTGILAEGRQAHVAIDTSNGPHVTPQLYTWSGGRLWFAAATTTRKAAVLSDRSRAAAVVSVPGRSVVLSGPVTVLDPRKPHSMLRRLGDVPETVRASLGYAARNAADLAGFARDALRGRLGWRVPPVRVVYSLTPDHLAEIQDDAVVWSSGWPDAGRADGTTGGDDRAGDGGGRSRDGIRGGTPAVLAMPGPVAAPALWLVDRGVVVVAPAVAARLGIDGQTGPVAVVVDRYNGAGPAAKQGALVRGDAEPIGPGRFRLHPDRVVEWHGVEMHGVDVEGTDVEGADGEGAGLDALST